MQRYLSYLLSSTATATEPVAHTILVLQQLFEANEISRWVPYAGFYNADLALYPGLEDDYRRTLSAVGNQFTLCRFPFLLNVAAKTRLLRTENVDSMAENVIIGALAGVPFLVLEVRRSHLSEDTLCQISTWQHQPRFLRKPLKIKFVGEEGVDEGGLLKEYFQVGI